MILHGRNVIFTAGGYVVGAAKSCSLDIDVDMQEVSSPTQGQWKNYIKSRIGWKIKTSHLLIDYGSSIPYATKSRISIEANGVGKAVCSWPGDNNAYSDYNGPGLLLTVIRASQDGTFSYENDEVCEYEGSPDEMNALFSTYGTAGSPYLFLMASAGRYELNASTQALIKSKLRLTVPTTTGSFGAFALIGSPIASFNGATRITQNPGEPVHLNLDVYSGQTAAADIENIGHSPLTSFLKMAGNTYNISMEVDGYAARITGTAICSQCNVIATINNLATGSFAWAGSGPLNIPE